MHTMSSPQKFSSQTFGFNFQNSYLNLPNEFYTSAQAQTFSAPELILFNTKLAEELNLDEPALNSENGALIFSGQLLPHGANPLAQAYAGHQFGRFTMLGDGRALLIGEHITKQGHRFDIQLKGSGQTHYSRRGDGKSALGPMLREYIISHAMQALGIPTTLSLAVVRTNETVFRDKPLPGGILTRVAQSHIRVGTFQFATALNNIEFLKSLADYTIQRHYPECAFTINPYESFLNSVCTNQAQLLAQWMSVGFIHGVMNTDNTSICGETIDYGPCAFMNTYDPQTVFSSIDKDGRYAYGHQPQILHWNLARFAETLLPLLHSKTDESVIIAQNALQKFENEFHTFYKDKLRKKLGLFTHQDEDTDLINNLLKIMFEKKMDFNNTFRALSLTPRERETYFIQYEAKPWLDAWLNRIQKQPQAYEDVILCMQANNPNIIPRNHKVEDALAEACEQQNFVPFNQLLQALSTPYQSRPEHKNYITPPGPESCDYKTFCGT